MYFNLKAEADNGHSLVINVCQHFANHSLYKMFRDDLRGVKAVHGNDA